MSAAIEPTVPGATRYHGQHERPGRYEYSPELWRLLDQAPKGDPQRERVYFWQWRVLGTGAPLLGEFPDGSITKTSARSAALAYLTDVWNRFAKDFEPYYTGVPSLRIGFHCCWGFRMNLRRSSQGAHASTMRHSIYCRVKSLRRPTILHEVSHLLAWGDKHGPQFCSVLLYLWEREFGIDRTHALEVARQLGVLVQEART